MWYILSRWGLLLLVGGLLFISLTLVTFVADAAQKGVVSLSPSTSTWWDFTPTGWVTSVPLTAAISVNDSLGLDPGTAEYRISTDGGMSWTTWGNANLTYYSPISVAMRITVTNLMLPDSASDNIIAFRVNDLLGGTDSTTRTIMVDARGPTTTISVPAYAGPAWDRLIRGTASDTTNAVQRVEITVQRASDHSYLNAAGGWSVIQTWLTATGTTMWQYSLAGVLLETGSHTVTARAFDTLGNEQSPHTTAVFVYDILPPETVVSTCVISPYYGPNSWPGQVHGYAQDASGVVAVNLTLQRQDNGTYYNGLGGWSGTVVTLSADLVNPGGSYTDWSYPFAPTEDVTLTVRASAVDLAGNRQEPLASCAFVYDATSPSAPTNITVYPDTWTRINSFEIFWQNPADPSGIVGAYYKIGAPPEASSDYTGFSSGADISAIAGITVTGEGKHNVYLWLEDGAGNSDYRLPHRAEVIDAFKLDTTPPATSIITEGTSVQNGWWHPPVILRLFPNDEKVGINATSGVSATFHQIGAGSWISGTEVTVTTQCTTTVSYYSVDRAGNEELPHSIHVKIDSVPPTTTIGVITGTIGCLDWYTGPVQALLSVFDECSGVDITRYRIETDGLWRQGTLMSIENDGVFTPTFYSTDLAGNAESVVTATTPIKIDTRAPWTTVAITGPGSVPGWFTGSVTATLTVTDGFPLWAVSGVKRTEYNRNNTGWVTWTGGPVQISGEGRHSFAYRSVDNACNISPTAVITVNIDQTPPSRFPVLPQVQPSDWTRTNAFTISWTQNPVDALSGFGGVRYVLDVPPQSAYVGTLITGTNLSAIGPITVPSEGAHTLYIWPQDVAGNAQAGYDILSLKYDATPPTTTPVISGTRCVGSQWYKPPVVVTLTAVDALPGSTMNGGLIAWNDILEGMPTGWITETYPSGGKVITLTASGRHYLDYRAVDRAGNVESAGRATIWIDGVAPNVPTIVGVNPVTWTANNNFTISYLASDPAPGSGIKQAYYKVGTAPVSPGDYDGYQAAAGFPYMIENVHIPSEGRWTVYVWLEDVACNADYTRYATATLYYDATGPTMTVSYTGTSGLNGWHVSLPLTITISGVDTASGWDPASLRYRYQGCDGDWSAWITGTSFPITCEGVISFEYSSKDVAGNWVTATNAVKIDTTAPTPWVEVGLRQTASSFPVTWGATDVGGSGLAITETYDVQWRRGTDGSWQDWQVGVTATSAQFSGAIPGWTYYFRARARDQAGNARDWADVYTAYTFVDVGIIQNPGFESGLTGWTTGGELGVSIVQTDWCGQGQTKAVRLGNPDYPNDEVPVAQAVVSQWINVPPANQIPNPGLLFGYHIRTYDFVWGCWLDLYYDSFEVHVQTQDGKDHWLFWDGNWERCRLRLFTDLGCRQGFVDLTPFSGQRVLLQFSVRNSSGTPYPPSGPVVFEGTDWYNTWAEVDDLQIVNLEAKIRLPVIRRGICAGPPSCGFGWSSLDLAGPSR